MKNVYHILNEYPALESYEMYKETEELAQRLVCSGLLRIDANEKRNFVRLNLPLYRIDLTFSHRQITYDHLIYESKNALRYALDNANYGDVNKNVEKFWQDLQKQAKQNFDVPFEWEIKIARLLVQSSHPIVTHLILLEKVEIFLGFGFEIGDVMTVKDWQSSGKNSGMQSTNGIDSTIYVSCGGNPFIIDKEHATYTTDGFSSIARCMIIAGQEMGHYADLLRDEHGRKISRHSANLYGTKAKENVRIGRLNDIERNNRLKKKLFKLGLGILIRRDRSYMQYKKYNVRGIKVYNSYIKMIIFRSFFKLICKIYKVKLFKELRPERCLGLQIITLLDDMQFNLAPKADVYSNDNPQIEEAIACIEALARVPQQVNKWGRNACSICMQELYIIYYNQLIPACINSYENMTGQKYKAKLTKKIIPIHIFIRNIFKKPQKSKMSPLIPKATDF